jgi:hypothetical protein
VQTFIPPVVFGDVQTWNSWGFVLHLRDLFAESHTANQIIDAKS